MLTHINYEALSNMFDCILELSKNKENEQIIRKMVINCIQLYAKNIDKDVAEDNKTITELIQDLYNQIEHYSTNEIIFQYFEKEHFSENLTDTEWTIICQTSINEICNGNDPLRMLVEDIIHNLNNDSELTYSDSE